MSVVNNLKAGRTLSASGFTLTELLIALVIVSILAAIAYPAYTRQVQTSRQSEAQGQMMALATGLEGYRSRNFTYKDAGSSANIAAMSPDIANNDFYTVSVAVPSPYQSYVITMTPKSGSAMAGTEVMKLDDKGRNCMKTGGCTLGTDPSWGD
ncbi:secretion protein [Alcanivorax hongdengensis A-11-3]|uniref:Secretion protein n=1 Tax=Alcanivorax hongdengensis A-11-3 TaxID=1177179 RepID=L0WBY4_9GAMM|nr:type IV pilin protein [Alcanivorax hongdengensis]EKF74494.1 secretion protein [Alcanivorax hongdengensis A-11-3]